MVQNACTQSQSPAFPALHGFAFPKQWLWCAGWKVASLCCSRLRLFHRRPDQHRPFEYILSLFLTLLDFSASWKNGSLVRNLKRRPDVKMRMVKLTERKSQWNETCWSCSLQTSDSSKDTFPIFPSKLLYFSTLQTTENPTMPRRERPNTVAPC